MAWATAQDVQDITGITVDDPTVALASAMIDTFSDADETAPQDSITTEDRRRLKRATAWQAVWVKDKPGLISQRENASSTSSDGQSISRQDRTDAMLAPLARRELLALSWVGTRSVRVPRRRFMRDARIDFLNEESDRYGQWMPIGDGPLT